MNIERFTQRSKQALAAAQQLAAEKHHQEVSGKHLMWALLKQDQGLIPRLLEQGGVNLLVFEQYLEELLGKIPAVYGYEGSVYISSALTRVLSWAEKEARRQLYFSWAYWCRENGAEQGLGRSTV